MISGSFKSEEVSAGLTPVPALPDEPDAGPPAPSTPASIEPLPLEPLQPAASRGVEGKNRFR